MAQESRSGPAARPLPASIGRYKIVSRIGKGAMGVVYHAHDELMDRAVAIKVLTADLAGDPSIRTRFFREAKVAGQIVHANVITVFDMGEENGRLYIVMELLQGQTLGDYLREHPDLTLAEKVDVMTQVCSGMVAAHARGVVHRDLKPSNLFVQPDGVVKVLDFGVARLADSNVTAAGLIIGTPDYMSPEQARGGDIDARADVFSAGAVFYYLLTGRRPFVAKDLPALLHKVEFVDPPPIPEQDAPPVVASIVLKALQKEPARRYQSFNDLLADVLRFHKTYDAELRRALQNARTGFAAVQQLTEARRAATAVLGLDPPAPDEVATLVARYPGLDDSAGVEVGRGGFARNLPEMLQDVEQVRERLTAESSRLGGLAERFLEGESAWAAGELAGAEHALSDVARELPGATQVQQVLRQVHEAQRRQAQSAQQEQEMLAAAVAACDAGKWTQAVRVCDELLQVAPQSVRAQELRAHAARELAQQAAAAQRREQALVRAGEAGAALLGGDLPTALTLAQEALGLDATCPQAIDVLARSQAAQKEASARAARVARGKAHLTQAREWLDKGRFDRAAHEAALARQVDPADQGAVAVLAEVQRRQAAAEAQRAAVRSARSASLRALFSNAYLWVGLLALGVLGGGGLWLVRGGARGPATTAEPAPTAVLATPAPAPPVEPPAPGPAPVDTPPASPPATTGQGPVTAAPGDPTAPVRLPPTPGATGLEPELPPLPQRAGESEEQWVARRREASGRFAEAQGLLGRRRFAQALVIFEALARSEPDYPGIQERLLATRREIEVATPSPQRLFAEAQRLEGNGDMVGAMAKYRAAQAADPNLPALAERMASLQALMETRAERLISEAEKAAPGDPASAIRRLEEALRYLPADHPRAGAARREIERLRGGAR